MTLENTLRQQLNKPQTGGFQVSHGDWTITVLADKTDSLSCALKELILEKNTPIGFELDAWAMGIASKATGLLESLSLIEIDRPLGKALLRSGSPSVNEGKAFYYEMLLERATHTRANLRRFVGQNGEKREVVSFVLTHDAIVKLVSDIIGE